MSRKPTQEEMLKLRSKAAPIVLALLLAVMIVYFVLALGIYALLQAVVPLPGVPSHP